MAAATQLQFMNFTSSPVPTEKRKRRRSMDDVKKQTEYLACYVVVNFLQQEDITINGFVKKSKDACTQTLEDPCCHTKEFATACSNLISACKFMREKHGRELLEMCDKLDISDEQLHSNFRILMSTIWQEPLNWGRLVSLFVVTGVLSARLYREGHKNKIESVLGWFKAYLRDNADPWIRERGGWVSVGEREDNVACGGRTTRKGEARTRLGYNGAFPISCCWP